MSHACNSLVLHCIDFRFGTAIKQFLETERHLGDCDIVSLAGAAKNIVNPASPSDAEFALRQIDISKRLHNINNVILINHTDCGAYGGRSAFASREEEDTKHATDLAEAKKIILDRFPGLEVTTLIAQIEPDSTIHIEEA